MHKNGKWAKQILDLQKPDGSWGDFHSLSQRSDSAITTEQALRRLERLGYTIEDPCIQKAVDYLSDCLAGIQTIPDRREKTHDWDLFSAMMLSTWLRRFTKENETANLMARNWAEIIARAFHGGGYDHRSYAEAFCEYFGTAPRGGRFTDFVSFYQISLMAGSLDRQTEINLFSYVLHRNSGIYCVYDKCLTEPPPCFVSRETSRYLAALELLAEYPCAKETLGFAADWLRKNRSENETWDLGAAANDKIYLPLSDNWRMKETRTTDCTERITKLLNNLTE